MSSMPHDHNGEYHVRGAATMRGNASRPQQRLDTEPGIVDTNHRHSQDHYDDTMQSERYRAGDSPRYAPRQSDVPGDPGAPSPRFGREHVSFAGDTYRPPPRSPIRTRSPPNRRGSYRRHRQGPCDSYRPPPRTTRPDPSDHYPEPLRRPSPTRRPSAPKNHLSSSAMSAKSPRLEDKDPRKRMPLYRNPAWTKPTEPPPTKSSARIEVNGIKDVPSGPAKSSQTPTKPSHEAAKSKQRPVPEHVKRSPHIFISAHHLAPLTSTIIHLKKYLKQHQPIELHMDETGYYLRFPDSPPGKLRLALCKKMYNGKPLFGMYTLSMQAFADGQPMDEDPSHTTEPEHFNEASPARNSQDDDEATGAQDGKAQANGQNVRRNHLSKGQIAVANTLAISSDPCLQKRVSHQVSMPDPALPEPPFVALEDEATIFATRLSPSRSTARTFHDDGASSISGRTSEVSASGKLCHVCKMRSELDTLVGCSVCPRRYHRHCHVTTTVPADPGPSWLCQRCIQKRRLPKRALDHAPIQDTRNISAASGSPPAKKMKISSTAAEATSKADIQATALGNDIQPTANGQRRPISVQTDREHVEEKRFSKTIAMSIGKNVGKDDFIIPSDKSTEALGSQYSIEIAKALNMHPSLDGILRRRVSDVMLSSLATDRTIGKELINDKSNIDMLITSSCTPAEGRKTPDKSQAVASPIHCRIDHGGNDGHDSAGQKLGASTSDVVAAPVATKLSPAEVPAPEKSSPSAPRTEADELVELSFSTGNGPDKADASDTLQRPAKLSMVRRKIKPVNHDTALHAASHGAPDSPVTKDATTDSSGTPAVSSVTQPLSEASTSTADKELQCWGPKILPDQRPTRNIVASPQVTIDAQQVPRSRDGIASSSTVPDAAKRTKPQPAKGDRVDCAGCGKVKVPRHPSGRMLCLRCKQKATAETSAAPSVASSTVASPALERSAQTLPIRDEPVLDAALQGASTSGQTPRVADLIDRDVGDDDELPLQAVCAECRRRHLKCTHRTSQETVCKGCRRQHRKCDHRSRSTSSGPCEDCRRRRIRCEHFSNENEEAEDDLNFWSTRSTSSCEQCGGVHDAMACPMRSSTISEPLSASGQLFAVIEGSQQEQLEVQVTQSPPSLVNMQAEHSRSTNNRLQQPTSKRVPQEDIEAGHPPSQAQRKKSKHASYRRPAVDENDLGDSNTRPKGTYSRLIGMALCEAPGNRLDPASAAKWVADNIPGYSEGQGTWKGSLKATMIHDAKSVKSTRLAERVLENGRIIYQMLPHMVETHERWNHELQRPVMPGGLARPAQNPEDDANMEDSDFDGSLGSPELSRSSQAKRTKQSPPQHPQGRQTNDGDEMEIGHDEPTALSVNENCLAGVYESSEDEPLAVRRKHAFAAPVTHMASIRSPLSKRSAKGAMPDATGYQAMEQSTGMQSGLVRVVERAAPPKGDQDNQMPDELLLRALVRDEIAEQEYSAKSPRDEWPELYPDLQLNRTAKMAEIKSRPRRKQLFGTAHAAGTVNDLNAWQTRGQDHFPVLRHDPFSGALNDEEEDGTRSKRCTKLKHFLNVPDDLEPHVLDGQLAYRHRNGRARTVYKTGI